MAFFPNQPPAQRQVIVYPKFLTTSYDQVGVLRHEPGHVLGFRHEHIRPEAPVIARRQEDNEIGDVDITPRPITPFDIHSVMHYPVPGIPTKFEITDFDRLGSETLYGPPADKVEDWD